MLAVQASHAAEPQTVTVTAEGLADPKADTYQRDKGLMIDDLRRDAKRQILEKAVGAYVESSTLMKNYTLIHDKILTRSQGVIKRVVKESEPYAGADGLMHLLMTAEVYTGDVKAALSEMGRQERVDLIREAGNPRIAVAIDVSDTESGAPRQSGMAENIVKERLQSFGYRVVDAKNGQAADFTITGEAKLKTFTDTLAASGVTLTKYALTSFSVKCVDNATGEEIYHDTRVSEKSWPDKDQAVAAIGGMIGEDFSKEFFAERINTPVRTCRLEVEGLPDYDAAALLRKEFIGLRPVLDVTLKGFDRSGTSKYEVEFAGAGGGFAQFLNTAILTPLNATFGAGSFTLESAHGDAARVVFHPGANPAAFGAKSGAALNAIKNF